MEASCEKLLARVDSKRKQIADAAREGAGSAICTHWCAQCRIPAPSSCTRPLAHSAERGVEHATKGMRDAEQGTKGMEEKLPDPSDTPSDPPESPWSRPFCFGSLHTEAFPWSTPLHSMPLPRPQCPRAATWRQYHAVTPGVKETSDGAQARLCNAGRKIGAKSSRRPATGATEMGSRDSRVSWTGYDELCKFAQ